ncbi:hypothetical protein EMIHUDRAFT_124703, partial [Emiliania huxleyi CCMP1516]|uniref:Uncharacterized protein n=2 Tax=Emiliania huxleyi TaxID=2903 RepID=A0A0D3IIW0_EMIH1
MPQQSTLAAAALASPPSPPLVCPCLAAYPAGVSLVSGEVHVVAADGVSHPRVPRHVRPPRVEHERCYVDPAACNAEYSTAAYVVGATPHSSYRACGFSNEFESWFCQPPMPPPPSPPPDSRRRRPRRRPPSPPLDCPCLAAYPAGVSLVSGEVQVVTADGVSHPRVPRHVRPPRVEHERCYVDPAACNTEYSTAAYVVGATLHSSYRACGFSNEFES